jgi:putative drug exporter of the RND superfamily
MIVVYLRAGGLSAPDRTKVDGDRLALAAVADGEVTGPIASADGEAAILTVPVAPHRLESGEVSTMVERAREIAADGRSDGLTVAVTGSAAARADASAASGQIAGTLTAVSLVVVAVLLVVIYRSPLLVVISLVCVVCAAVVAEGGAYLLGLAGATVSGSSLALLVVLVFGLGTDYALLLIARYREQQHLDSYAAMAKAWRAAFPSIAASGTTMASAALVLLAADMNSTAGLGPVAAVAVASAMLAMLTLLPALLILAGRAAFWPRIRARPRGRDRREPVAVRRPHAAWAVGGAALAIGSLGVLGLHVGTLDARDSFTRPPESVIGQTLMAQHFPSGITAPVLVYARSDVSAEIRAVPGVREVGPVERSGSWTRVTAILDDADDVEALQRIRAVDGVVAGGALAQRVDRDAAMDRDLFVIVPLILGVVAVILGLLLRAITAALVLLACTLASASAALGLATLLFHAMGMARVDQTVLTFGFLFLVALGVDYTIFLMARAREEVATRGHRAGIAAALTATGGVITGAALVLAATFAALALTPVVVNIQLGLLVAVGVLVDAFVARTVVVPALALSIGPRFWWPGQAGGIGRPDR